MQTGYNTYIYCSLTLDNINYKRHLISRPFSATYMRSVFCRKENVFRFFAVFFFQVCSSFVAEYCSHAGNSSSSRSSSSIRSGGRSSSSSRYSNRGSSSFSGNVSSKSNRTITCINSNYYNINTELIEGIFVLLSK